MYGTMREQLAATLAEIDAAGLTKSERELTTPQGASIEVASGGAALNFCANNYLGLADHPDVVAAAHEALDRWGFGMASVRFICGTQTPHRELERRIAGFLGTDDAILYSSCFDANGGVFEVLFGADDAIISDELNHASLIDGIRLSKAARYRYRNADMADLEEQLRAAGSARRKVVVTDGVFSMDGVFAPLREICDLAEKHGALVFVDDSHAVGFVGEDGRGTPELFGVTDRVDIVTGTLGKALGGASGGYVAAHAEIVALLRQRSRPYLFSNSVAPVVVAGSLRALDLVASSGDARARLRANTALFRPWRPRRRWVRTRSPRCCSRARRGRAGRRASPSTCWATGSTSSRSATPWSPAGRRASASSCRPPTRPRTCGPASPPSSRPGTPWDDPPRPG